MGLTTKPTRRRIRSRTSARRSGSARPNTVRRMTSSVILCISACTGKGRPIGHAWIHRLLLGPGGRVALIRRLLLGHTTWSFVQTRAEKTSFRHLEDEARYALQLRAQAFAGGLRGVNAAAEHVLLAVNVGEGAHEGGRDDEDRRRRVDRGLRHQTLEHARAETGQIGEDPADAEEVHLIPLERHAEGEAHRIGLGNQQIQERVDEIVDQLPSRVAGLQVPHYGVARAIAETREYRFPELLLAPPMVVERP